MTHASVKFKEVYFQGDYWCLKNAMFTTALSLSLAKVYAASTICGCIATEMLKKLVLMTGESVKNTLLMQLGAICVDTIVKTFQILGKMIFGRLLKMFQTSHPCLNHLELTQHSLGAKTTFIGKKKDQVLKITKVICETGIVKLDLQILTTTSIKILKENMVSLLSGIKTSFLSKTMSALSVNSPKRLSSETRSFPCRSITATKQEKQEVCFAQDAIVDLDYFRTMCNFSKMRLNISSLTLNRRK